MNDHDEEGVEFGDPQIHERVGDVAPGVGSFSETGQRFKSFLIGTVSFVGFCAWIWAGFGFLKAVALLLCINASYQTWKLTRSELYAEKAGAWLKSHFRMGQVFLVTLIACVLITSVDGMSSMWVVFTTVFLVNAGYLQLLAGSIAPEDPSLTNDALPHAQFIGLMMKGLIAVYPILYLSSASGMFFFALSSLPMFAIAFLAFHRTLGAGVALLTIVVGSIFLVLGADYPAMDGLDQGMFNIFAMVWSLVVVGAALSPSDSDPSSFRE